MENKIPCKDCILFAKCNSIINGYHDLMKVKSKCSLLTEWSFDVPFAYQVQKETMKIFNYKFPCYECHKLEHCREISTSYDFDRYIISPVILRECKAITVHSFEFVRYFLNPSLPESKYWELKVKN